MGTLSINKVNRLFWLGRYLDRVCITLNYAQEIYDASVDGCAPANYADYCARMGIPNRYISAQDFCTRYLFDVSDPNSVICSLRFAYDNAIVLRATLGSAALAYIQMAMNAMDMAAASEAPMMELQWVRDDIMAFRGCCYEEMMDDDGRNIIKTGTSLEQVDLLIRMGEPQEQIHREFLKLFNRLYKTPLTPNRAALDVLIDAVLDENAPTPPTSQLLAPLEGLFPGI